MLRTVHWWALHIELFSFHRFWFCEDEMLGADSDIREDGEINLKVILKQNEKSSLSKLA